MLTSQRTAWAASAVLAGLVLATAPTVTASAAPTTAPAASIKAAAHASCGYYEGTRTTLRGDNSDRVREVQCLINRWQGNDPLEIDGNFGPRTESWVVYFQDVKGLRVDGGVGPQSWDALRGV
ncbi:peptidoglycan-binding domain-containing protein [Streptomyces sp. NPDC050636]|uniref:peptidoglycan-binding domain-containing protein n=1 Tax=Streptomyces sp. NPDC050636 TaxID=3154510 RepID=UPI003425ABEA